jgi:hypothetical protein
MIGENIMKHFLIDSVDNGCLVLKLTYSAVLGILVPFTILILPILLLAFSFYFNKKLVFKGI